MSTGGTVSKKEQTVRHFQIPVSLPCLILGLSGNSCTGLCFAEWPPGQVSKEALTQLTLMFRGYSRACSCQSGGGFSPGLSLDSGPYWHSPCVLSWLVALKRAKCKRVSENRQLQVGGEVKKSGFPWSAREMLHEKKHKSGVAKCDLTQDRKILLKNQC